MTLTSMISMIYSWNWRSIAITYISTFRLFVYFICNIYSMTNCCSNMWPAIIFPDLWRWNDIKRKTLSKCHVAKPSTCHTGNYIFYYQSQKICMIIIYSRYTM
jgi:hypothetical protein